MATDDRGEVSLNWTLPTGETRWMLFDVVTVLQHTGTVSITDDPVEDGSATSDNAYNEPDQVQIGGVVSDTPLPSNPGAGNNDDRLVRRAFLRPTNINFVLPEPPLRPSLGGLVGAGLDLFLRPKQTQASNLATNRGAYVDRVGDAFRLLRGVKEQFLLVNIQTPVRSYKNMLIRTMVVPETIEMGDAKEFSLDFRELQIGSTRITNSPLPGEVIAQAGDLSNANNGTTPGNAAEQEAKAKNNATYLKRIVDSGVDLLGGTVP